VTTTLDSKRRAVIKTFKPGDVLQVEEQGPDIVLLRRMKPVEHPKPKLVRRKGELVVAGGSPITSEEVKRLLEDFP
jgi:hypothetical protein